MSSPAWHATRHASLTKVILYIAPQHWRNVFTTSKLAPLVRGAQQAMMNFGEKPRDEECCMNHSVGPPTDRNDVIERHRSHHTHKERTHTPNSQCHRYQPISVPGDRLSQWQQKTIIPMATGKEARTLYCFAILSLDCHTNLDTFCSKSVRFGLMMLKIFLARSLWTLLFRLNRQILIQKVVGWLYLKKRAKLKNVTALMQ